LSFSLLSKHLKIKIYRTIILTVVLYGCETWSLTLREERRLRVFENRVLRIFGPKRDEVTGKWRTLHNKELNPFQPRDAIWNHAFHLFLICMLLPIGSSSHLSTLR